MDAVHFISNCLAQVHLRLMATCYDLTQYQLLWRPAPTANNIGFILWHLVRNEDTRAGSLRHLITHKNNHHGQIDYLRGLQDEEWDLPRGTGIVLP